MTCEQTMTQVHHALDQENGIALPPAAVEHLATCATCRNRFAKLRVVHATLPQMPSSADEQLPRGFHTRLTQRLAQEPAHGIARTTMAWRSVRNAGLAIAAVLLVAVGIQLLGSNGTTSNIGAGRSQTNQLPSQPKPDQQAAVALMSDLESLREAKLPTAERLYASALPGMQDFANSLVHTTTLLANSLTPANNKVANN